MKKSIRKIKMFFLIVLATLSFATAIYADNPMLSVNPLEILLYQNYIFSKIYPEFLLAVAEKKDIDNYSCQTIFKSENDKLIIGCSPVAFLGIYAKDIANKFNYDLVGFGGTTDEQMLSWLKTINKKYNKVVIWGTANDIFQAIEGNKDLDGSYFNVLDNLLIEAKNHLSNAPAAKVVYLKVKYATPDDAFTVDRMIKFNSMAEVVNNYVDGHKDIVTVDVTPDTTEKNSAWFLHYTNKDAFSTILNDIEVVCRLKS